MIVGSSFFLYIGFYFSCTSHKKEMNENREYRIETNSEMFFLCLQYHGLRKFGLSEIIPGFSF